MKRYICPNCGLIATSEEWNKETKVQFNIVDDDYFVSIEDNASGSYFYCPNCKKEVNISFIKTEEFLDNEIVEYFVVNSELNMSVGKVAVQVAHAATIITVEKSNKKWDLFWQWYESDQKKIILRGKQKDLERLIDAGFYYIRDNGLTEIPSGSLTCVGLPPMLKRDAQKYVKRLQLY